MRKVCFCGKERKKKLTDIGFILLVFRGLDNSVFGRFVQGQLDGYSLDIGSDWFVYQSTSVTNLSLLSKLNNCSFALFLLHRKYANLRKSTIMLRVSLRNKRQLMASEESLRTLRSAVAMRHVSETKCFWHIFSIRKYKHFMKSILPGRSTAQRKTDNDFNVGGTIAVILLLLLFIGTSFYLMVTNF